MPLPSLPSLVIVSTPGSSVTELIFGSSNEKRMPATRCAVGDVAAPAIVGRVRAASASPREPTSGRALRLESVQNANDQARCALATLLGNPEPYRALPWFWSEQGSLRLQMAGLMPAEGTRYRRPGATPASFSILHYVGERLVCVESVNAPVEHMTARKLLEAGRSPEPSVACDASVALKTHLL